jgi:hypothetical protein
MNNLIKMNYIWFLSFVIIGLFVYSTNNLYQSFSMQEEVDSSNLENNEESDNNIFNSLSRTLPNSNDGDLSEQNEDISNEEAIFDNFNTENSINEEEINTINTESEEQESGDILTESMNNDGNQETEIISENDGSDDIEMSPSNNDNNNDENENIDNTDNIGTN